MSHPPTPPGAPPAPLIYPVTVDLSTLIESTAGMTEPELHTRGLTLYNRNCVVPGMGGQVRTHDGQRVDFYDQDYHHGFWKAANKGRRGVFKDGPDERRVQRARWIVPVVSGHVPGTECWLITDHRSPDNPKPIQRLYVVRKEPYVVYLRVRKDGWAFRTAYCPSWDDIKRYTKDQQLLWHRNT